jgi:hypothetical protein
MAGNQPELKNVLAQLRTQLAAAQREGNNAGLRFEIEDIEVELNVAVTAEGGGNAGVKFLVVTGNLDGKASREVTQKIKLKLKPRNGTGGSVQISDEDDDEPGQAG